MKQKPMYMIAFIFTILALICFVGKLITNNKNLSGIMFICIGFVFVFQYLPYLFNAIDTKKKILNMQLMGSFLMMSIGIADVLINYFRLS